MAAANAAEALIFLHVPKSAGTTLNRLIEREISALRDVLGRSGSVPVVKGAPLADPSAGAKEVSRLQRPHAVLGCTRSSRNQLLISP